MTGCLLCGAAFWANGNVPVTQVVCDVQMRLARAPVCACRPKSSGSLPAERNGSQRKELAREASAVVTFRPPTATGWAAALACSERPDGQGCHPSIMPCFGRRWRGRLATSPVPPCRGVDEPCAFGADHWF
jgi:hypothetical protein